MDIKSVKDMNALAKNAKSKTEDYDAPKYLVKPHEGEALTPFIEKEYMQSKKDANGNSPFVTTSYKKFIESQKKKNISNKSK